jgi:cytochrome c oxidase subunit III
MSQAAHGHDGDGHHHGSPFIQHHFDDAKHQFESGKLGIWLFLAQEVLFFSALFVAYIIYRANNPEIFDYAHSYLDVKMGAVNTAVLIISSLTAAWAVRCAQLNQRRGLLLTLGVTLVCAMIFLGIKYVEYSHKVHIGTLYGERFDPSEDPDGKPLITQKQLAAADGDMAAALAAAGLEEGDLGRPPPPKTSMFFTIYFAMTGLHGIHVLAGVFVFIWLFWRALKGHFTPDYFGPVDYAALYWHLVDLIWIYLFPLLYLIH